MRFMFVLLGFQTPWAATGALRAALLLFRPRADADATRKSIGHAKDDIQ
jgi:hypothetical protein